MNEAEQAELPLSSRSSQVSLAAADTEPDLEDPLFAFSPAFLKKSRKEKELLFTKAFDERILYIRNKELKCSTTVPQHMIEDEEKQRIMDARSKYIEKLKAQEVRKTVTRKETAYLKTHAVRTERTESPTFDTLLNTSFNAQKYLLKATKDILTRMLIENRARRRISQLNRYLTSGETAIAKTVPDELETRSQSDLMSLLTVQVVCTREKLSFLEPEVDKKSELPDVQLESFKAEKPFPLYTPGLVERYNLTPYPRTDLSTFIPIPISKPDKFPVVKEEQPIIEKAPLPSEKRPYSDVESFTPPLELFPINNVKPHEKEIKYFKTDPYYDLRPQPMEFSDIPDEVGMASILSIGADEYEKLGFPDKTRPPFEFTGVSDFWQTGITSTAHGFQLMDGPDPQDLRELDVDDDIDGIDVRPKPKPITDFLSKPISTKSKADITAEAISEGQVYWNNRQRKYVSQFVDSLKSINSIISDPALKLDISDMEAFLKS